eukprot:scaffold36290_cov146-Isochrysis_galbana.AAC.1
MSTSSPVEAWLRTWGRHGGAAGRGLAADDAVLRIGELAAICRRLPAHGYVDRRHEASKGKKGQSRGGAWGGYQVRHAPCAHRQRTRGHREAEKRTERGWMTAHATLFYSGNSGEDGEQYLRDSIGKAGSLVWVELGVGVCEGELRVGLAAISAGPPIGERAGRDGKDVWVEWFTRKSSKRAWGKSSVAFKSCFGMEGGRKIRLVSLEQVSDCLPVVVEVIASSSDGAPSVSKRSKEALMSHIGEHRPHLMVAAAVDDRSRAQPTKTRRRSGGLATRRESSGSSSDEDDDDEEDSSSSSSTDVDGGSSGSGGGGHDDDKGGADSRGWDEEQGEGGDEDGGSSDDPLQRAFERASASRRQCQCETQTQSPQRQPTRPLQF